MDFQAIKDRVRLFNREILNPITLSFAGRPYSPYAIVQHEGRKSGRMYTTPVVAREVEDGYVIPLPYGADTDWCRNVIAANGAVIAVSGDAYAVGHPEVIPPDEALGAFPAWMGWLLDAAETEAYLTVERVSDSPEPPSVYRTMIADYPISRAVLALGGVILIIALLIVLIRGLRREA
jgi:deazaflavin-dependent oxidoreductase (nitroreductase family)